MADAPIILVAPDGTLYREGSRGGAGADSVNISAPAVNVVLTPDSASTQIMAPSADITVTLGSAVTMVGQSLRLSNTSPTGNTLTLVRHADDGGGNLVILAAGADVHLESAGTVVDNWQFVTQTPSAFMNAVAVADGANTQLTDDQGPVIVATKAAGPGASQLRLPAFSLARLRQRIWTIVLDNTASGAAVGGGNEAAILSLRTSTGAALVPAINVPAGSRRVVTVGYDGAGAYIPFDAYNLENVRAWLQGPQTVIVDAGGAPTIYNILPGDSFCTVNNNSAGGDNLIIQLPLATGSGRMIGFNFLDASGGTINFRPAAPDQVQGAGVDFPYDPDQNDGVVWIRDHGTQQWRFDFVDANAVMTDDGSLQTRLEGITNLLSSASGTIPGGDGAGNLGDIGAGTSPVELLPGPAAGFYIEVVSFRTFLDYAGANYDGVAQNCALRYGAAGADVVTPVSSNALGITAGGVDQNYNWVVPHSTGFGVDGAGLQFYMAVNDPYAGAGNSPLEWEITFRIRSTAPNAP